MLIAWESSTLSETTVDLFTASSLFTGTEKFKSFMVLL